MRIDDRAAWCYRKKMKYELGRQLRMEVPALLGSWKWNRILAVALLTAIATPAVGADTKRVSIYGRRDDAGVEHFTNELADVPEAYRSRVATLVKDWISPEPPPQDAKSRPTENTAQPAQPSPMPPPRSDVPQADSSDNVNASQNVPVIQDTQVVAQPPVVSDDTLLPAGGPPSFARAARPPREVFEAAGPIPQDPAGAPPLGAASAPPLGAAGHSPIGFAGRRR